MKEELVNSLESYKSGNLVQGRIHLSQARTFAARVRRHQTTIKKSHGAQWALNLDPNKGFSVESLLMQQNIGQLWDLLGQWLDSVINSVGREQLLTSSEGIDLLIDRELPNYWDVNHDIVLLIGSNYSQFIDRLLSRGQKQIVVVRDSVPADQYVIYKPIEGESEAFATIFQLNRSESLNDQHLSALKKNELPTLKLVTTDSAAPALENLNTLLVQVRSQYMLEATRRLLNVKHVEQFLANLPSMYDMKSVAILEDSFAGQDVMLASGGPSLVNSLSAISAHRDSFVLVAILRSLPALLDFGITPDFIIMTDAADHTSRGLLPDDSRFYDIPLIVADYAHPSTFEDRFKSYFLIPNPKFIRSPISSAIHGSRALKVSGGSVAVNAVSIFAQFNIRSMTLVGQDLSVPLSGPTYASADVPAQADLTAREHLTCKGIDGSDLPTLPDYASYIKEFETLASVLKSDIRCYNCTSEGAYLHNWQHLPLDLNHPVVSERSNSRECLKSLSSLDRGRRKSDQRRETILTAIIDEVLSLTNLGQLADSAAGEVKALLSGAKKDLSSLESIEAELLVAMPAEGSLISEYLLPHKLEAEASMESVDNLEENLMISLYYHGALVAGSKRLKELLEAAMAGMVSKN